MSESGGQLPPFRREVGRIRPYRVANPPHTIKLNQNESSVELPQRLKRKITARLCEERWARYPSFPATHLARRIADAEGLAEENVLLGHGSNELLYALVLVTLEKGRTLLMPTPSYFVVKLAARLAGAKVHTVPLTDDFLYEPERITRTIRRVRPRLVFLPSPNNPTGSSLSPEGVEAVLRSTRSIVAIDEAYREFTEIRLAPLLPRYRNLVLLRSFSKAYRLAGLRIGYLLGDPDVLDRVERGKPPHSVDLFSQVAGETLLEERDTIDKDVARVLRERERMGKALASLPGVDVFPSDANFLLIRVPDGARVDAALLRKGILVRNVGSARPRDPRLENCLRITIGTSSENRALLETISANLVEGT